MEGMNLLCEAQSCGKPAVAFGMKETLKFRSCEEHVSPYLKKGMQIYDIEGYSFISSHSDAAAFEERKAVTAKGRGNLTVLEASCDSELAEALRAIQTARTNAIKAVEQRCEEMAAAVTHACSERMQQFAEVRLCFEQYLHSQESQLPPTAKSLCANLSLVPKFLRFKVEEASDRVSAALSGSWVLSFADVRSTLKCLHAEHKKEAVESARAEASEYAKVGIKEALSYVYFLAGDEMPYSEVREFTELLQFEKVRIEDNLTWLKRSWELAQRYVCCGDTIVKTGQQLAALLSLQLGQYSTAETVLLQCYDLAELESPQCEESISICAYICGVYAASAQYEKVKQLGLWVLQTFATAGYPPAHYWGVLLHLTYSLRKLSKHSEASEILSQWREFRAGSALADMLRLVTFGVDADYGGDEAEAERLLQRARCIGTGYFPTSTCTALTFFRLAKVCSGNIREQLYRQAQSIYEVAAPKSIDAASNLTCMGQFFSSSQRWSEAEECYKQAQSICEVAGRESVDAAINLTYTGNLLREQSSEYTFEATETTANLSDLSTGARLSEAESCYQQAKSIYEATSPRSIEAARNLNNLGTLLKGREELSGAEECYKQARATYEVAAPQSIEAANNLADLGRLLQESQRRREAEECYRQVQSILDAIAPKSVKAASNLDCLGLLLKESKRWGEAEKFYRQAQALYETIAPRSIKAANNLNNLGILLRKRERRSEAEDCHRQAQSIYEEVAPASVSAGNNLYNLGILLKDSKRCDEAERCYRQAQSIYETVAPGSIQAANNLSNLGSLHFIQERLSEAEECYQQAQSAYEVSAPRSVSAADNLSNLGLLLFNLKRLDEAEACRRKARCIYEASAPSCIGAALNLGNLGLLFKGSERWDEAEECYRQARTIYESAAPKSVSAATNLYSLGRLLEATGRTEQAIECLREAKRIYSELGRTDYKSSVVDSIAQLKRQLSSCEE